MNTLNTINLADNILYAARKETELSMLLDGTPVTLRFPHKFILGLPAECQHDERVQQWLEDSKSNDTVASVVCPTSQEKNTLPSDSLSLTDVEVEAFTGDSSLLFESSLLRIKTSAVSLIGFGAFTPTAHSMT